jgi:hypothetical protein
MVNDSRFVNLKVNRGQRRLNPRALNDHLNKEMSELENIDAKIQHLSSTISENFTRKDSKFLIAYAKCAYNATCQVNYIFRVKERVIVNNMVDIYVEITNFHNHDRKSNQSKERIANCPFFEETKLDSPQTINSDDEKQYILPQPTYNFDHYYKASPPYCPFFDCPQTKLFMKNDNFSKSLEKIKSSENFKSEICPVKSVLTKSNNKRTICQAFYENESNDFQSPSSAFKRVSLDFDDNRNLKSVNQNIPSPEIKHNTHRNLETCSYKNNWIEILKEVIKKDLPLFPINKTHVNNEESFLHFYNLFFNHFISKIQTF